MTGGAVTPLGKLVWCCVRKRCSVGKLEGRKSQTEEGHTLMLSSVRRGAINAPVPLTHLPDGGGAAYFGGLPSGGLPSGENRHPISEPFSVGLFQ